jgi:CRP/FNR family transcriptional regulator, cyclic AMP receptor protein
MHETSTEALISGWPLGRLTELEAGTSLAQSKEPATSVWLILEGRCRWTALDPKERRRIVVELDAPCAIGLVEALTDVGFAHEITLVGPGRGLRVAADAMRASLAEDPRLTERCLGLLARYNVALARAEATQHLDLETRLAMHLLDCADRYGRPTESGLMIRHPLTEQTLADRLGSVPRSVRRVMAKWKQSGVLTRRRGWIVLDRPASLSSLVAKSA